MNASGRPNTCKSSGRSDFGWIESGVRVSNAYTICLQEGNSPGKPGLMPHGITGRHRSVIKATVLGDECASD